MLFLNGTIDAIPNISVISKIEVLGFNAPEEPYRLLESFMEDATIIDLSDNVVAISISIRRKNKTKLPDAIIAATALVYDLILITRNTHDFKNIEGLQIINPYEII